jgi:hypothetical protein
MANGIERFGGRARVPIREYAKVEGHSLPFVYNRIRTGKIKAFKHGRKTMIDVASAELDATSEPLVLGEPKSTPASRALAAKRAKGKLKAKASARRKAVDARVAP